MIDNWFTNRCMTLVGANGRALSGDALAAAEAALNDARSANRKLWTDRNGFVYQKERRLFAGASLLRDPAGNPVRICGKLVKVKAKFCSKCGSAAPGAWWRCGGCGRMIGNESETCPHCGHRQNRTLRADLADGSWQKDEEIFAERFEFPDVAALIPRGLNVQESQRAILLEGGAVTDVLDAGFYQTAELDGESGSGDRSIVMVDNAEFVIPVCVEKIRTADDMETDLHVLCALRFDPSGAKEFMCNLMGNSLYFHSGALCASLGYDQIAHSILQDIDGAARDFCNTRSVAELFKNAELRLQFEDHVAGRLTRNLRSAGLQFVRLKELEFESEVFEKLRAVSGELEAKRREIEFLKRAGELANDAVRREAMNEFEMEDYVNQLAHEKGVKDELRTQELERMRELQRQEKERSALRHENDLDDLQQSRQLARDMRDAGQEEELRDLRLNRELERRIAELNSSLEAMKLETQIQDIKLEIEQKRTAAEQQATAGWLKIKQQKQSFQQEQKIGMMKAAASADIKSMIMAEEDPEKREHLLRLHEQEMQSRMTPELLLAAAAARGSSGAAEALSRMNKEQIAAIERSRTENRELYENMLKMNERMFNSAMENMAKNGASGTTTTQIIK